MVDLTDGDRWIELGETRAWCWQQDPKREQVLYLFHLPSNRAVVLGRFHQPKEYANAWRCDLHPRITRDGKRVVIDSTHGGDGRQQYLVDISRVIQP